MANVSWKEIVYVWRWNREKSAVIVPETFTPHTFLEVNGYLMHIMTHFTNTIFFRIGEQLRVNLFYIQSKNPRRVAVAFLLILFCIQWWLFSDIYSTYSCFSEFIGMEMYKKNGMFSGFPLYMCICYFKNIFSFNNYMRYWDFVNILERQTKKLSQFLL